MSSIQQNVIQYKVGLLNLAAELGNVSRAFKVIGFSRDKFYCYQSDMEDGGVQCQPSQAKYQEPRRGSHGSGCHQICTGTARLRSGANLQLTAQRGIFVSPSGVRSIWLRQNLESFKKRLSSLERHVAETGSVLTEAQVQALAKKQEDDVLPMARSRLPTPAISAARTPSTSAPSRAWDEFTNRPSSTPIPSGLPPNSTPPRLRSRQPTCSTIVCYRSSPNRAWASYAS